MRIYIYICVYIYAYIYIYIYIIIWVYNIIVSPYKRHVLSVLAIGPVGDKSKLIILESEDQQPVGCTLPLYVGVRISSL